MNKNIFTLVIWTFLCIAVPTIASPPVVIEATTDYKQQLTKRQVVDHLLTDAVVAFKSPERLSHAGFTAKMPSNMEIVTARLLEAYALEPYRTDLLISAANAQIYNKNVDRAIELFEKALVAAPDDIDLHTYLTVWQRFRGNNQVANEHLLRLKTLDPSREADLTHLLTVIDRVIQTPLKEHPQDIVQSESAIVTLGYALNPDGSMHDILIKRLQKTVEVAKKNPRALIILTGGVPENHKTEGQVMAEWLVKQGINNKRIIEENYATSTVDNALFSSYILARHKIKRATIITSASHARRGQLLFEVASWQVGPKGIIFDAVVYPDKPLETIAVVNSDELLGIYRDALRTYGLWSYRSPPLEFR